MPRDFSHKALMAMLEYILNLTNTAVKIVMLEITQSTISHFPTNFNIWSTKIHFGQPNFPYIFNGTAVQ